MKPAQIRVFDGLRITTDHVNHLQGAFASGLQDLRQILGLGEAQTGLEVGVQDDGTVTIQPGVAFDFQKNRLACDDPLNLKVSFAKQDTTKYICLKYEQVEDGAVEGHPTIIWDSCSALVRDALPDRKENLVTLARVVRGVDGKLHVRPSEDIPPEVSTIIERPVPPTITPTGSADTSSQHPATEQTGISSSTPSISIPAVPTSSVPSAPEPVASAAAPADSAPTGVLRLRQGVAQLVSDASSSSYLKSVLAPAVRSKMAADQIDLSFPLGQAELMPDIAVSGFSTHCILSGDLTFPVTQDVPATNYHFGCVATGDATATAEGLLQFAACTMHMHPIPAKSGDLWSASDMTGRGAAEFGFVNWSYAPDVARPPIPSDVLAALRLLVQLVPAAPAFNITVKLVWSGKVGEPSLRILETQDIGFSWQVLFGWKALGF